MKQNSGRKISKNAIDNIRNSVMNNIKKPEILAPAGNSVMLKAAIDAGADAVYLGITGFNMRATAKNFELTQLKKIVKTCHDNNVKLYLTLNTIIYEDEQEKLNKAVKEAKNAGVDAVICWDYSVISACKKYKIPFDISTQASISNFEAVKFYSKLGAKRIVLARECTLMQITDIIRKIKKNKLNIEIEAFVHGAMCVSVSGRCFISQFLYKKSANRGDCIQPCRREYYVEDKETKEKLLVGSNYILSPKDLCTVGFIDKLIEAGISGLKIEGRGRSEEYVKTTVAAYRKAVDAYFEKKLTEELKKELIEELSTVYNRGFSSGFYLGKPTHEWTDKYGSKATKRKIYIGRVKKYYSKINVIEMKLENESLSQGDIIHVQGPTTGIVEGKVVSIQINGKNVNCAKKQQVAGIKTDIIVRPSDKIFIFKDA